MSLEYPKTENLYARSDETHKLIEGSWRNPAFYQIAAWMATEKIDGTNGRVILDWLHDDEDGWVPEVRVLGRTADDTMVAGLIEKKGLLQEAFGVEDAGELYERLFRTLKVLMHGGESDADLTEKLLYEEPVRMTLFGEFYGAGIQKGGIYSPIKKFRIFDVTTQKPIDVEPMPGNDYAVWAWGPPYWRPWEDVEDAATVSGIFTVPVLYSLEQIEVLTEVVREGFNSVVARVDGGTGGRAEGVVCRTNPYLYDSRHKRVMFKLKTKDLMPR